MNFKQLLGRINCAINKCHVFGAKFRRDCVWYQTCRVCGKTVGADAPVKRKGGAT
jgi:hypothetical protein